MKRRLRFKKAIEIDDTHAGAHYGLALADLLLGDKKSALTNVRHLRP